MTPEQFCYWLQGRAELNSESPTAEEWAIIRRHLDAVFLNVTQVHVENIDKQLKPIFTDKKLVC